MAVELPLGALVVLATRLGPRTFEAGCNLILELLKYLVARCPVVGAWTSATGPAGRATPVGPAPTGQEACEP